MPASRAACPNASETCRPRRREHDAVPGFLGSPRNDAARGMGSRVGESVSLLVFPSICFALWVSALSATGRRPAPGPFLAFRLGFRGRGVRRFAPDPPSSTRQVTCRVSPGGGIARALGGAAAETGTYGKKDYGKKDYQCQGRERSRGEKPRRVRSRRRGRGVRDGRVRRRLGRGGLLVSGVA
jgi:hypothetical protein